MATWTIRNVPLELDALLKERARRHRRSLNQQVIADLGDVVNGKEIPDPHRAELLIGMVNDLRSKMDSFMTAEEIDRAVEDGQR